MLTVNGVAAQVSSLLVITCYAKSLQETQAVLFVLERVQHTALIAREQDFVQNGWKNLPYLDPIGRRMHATMNTIDILQNSLNFFSSVASSYIHTTNHNLYYLHRSHRHFYV